MSPVQLAYCTAAIGAAWLVLLHAEPLDKPAPIRLTQDEATLEVIAPRPVLRLTTSKTGLPLQRKLDLLRDLLHDYFENHAKAPKYAFTFGRFDELNNRMAAVASCATDWDSRAGKPKSQNVNRWLLEQLNRSTVFGELTTLFGAFGYDAKISSMEGIFLCNAREISWSQSQRSCDTPLPKQGRFPCGALITFELSKR
jgi:hypothetical protein